MNDFESFLITGGAGFIGSHLAEHLLSRGHRVAVLDDLSTGRSSNIEHLLDRSGFEFVAGNVASVPTLDPLVEDADVVFHLAANVGVDRVMREGVLTLETSAMGTGAVLVAAERHGAKVMVASSSEVYGKGVRVPFAEGDDVVMGPSSEPRWAYAVSKLEDEFAALAYHRERSVPVVILRLFNIVGPRQVGRYGMVLPRFVAQALKGDDLTVYGSGTQSRTFCDVRDVVEAMVGLAAHPDGTGGVFNLGSDVELSILELARRVIDRLGSRSGVRLIPHEEVRPGFEDIERRVPDLTRIRRLTGWQASTPLSETIDAVSHELADALNSSNKESD